MTLPHQLTLLHISKHSINMDMLNRQNKKGMKREALAEGELKRTVRDILHLPPRFLLLCENINSEHETQFVIFTRNKIMCACNSMLNTSNLCYFKTFLDKISFYLRK